MKDKEGTIIKVGDLVKRCGKVLYADGLRSKISKNSWLVSKIEGGELYYNDGERDVKLARPKVEGDFIVVGDSKGISKDFKDVPKVLTIEAGSVQEKYRVLKELKDKGWKKGDVVAITGKVSFDTLEKGWLELVDKDTPNKHSLIVVDSLKVHGKANK